MGFSLGRLEIDPFETDFVVLVTGKDLCCSISLRSCLRTLPGCFELGLRIRKPDQNLKSPEFVSAACLAVAAVIHSVVVIVVVAVVVTQSPQIHEDLLPPE